MNTIPANTVITLYSVDHKRVMRTGRIPIVTSAIIHVFQIILIRRFPVYVFLCLENTPLIFDPKLDLVL